ncbi:hypothetical protein [Anaerostipes hominis (ex Lee et al. 2021)]|uniref:Uncharacterized protein n=1 Tax=Anaerostipes hominis (ex Lee et al. 2021) TaxID=2025494 RepID=A0ABV4DI44_9FIRM|nr:hypothetical protein [Anaerostipes hominis (ex Lee et al. 2021)]
MKHCQNGMHTAGRQWAAFPVICVSPAAPDPGTGDACALMCISLCHCRPHSFSVSAFQNH